LNERNCSSLLHLSIFISFEIGSVIAGWFVLLLYKQIADQAQLKFTGKQIKQGQYFIAYNSSII
jgi:hypothetical protein